MLVLRYREPGGSALCDSCGAPLAEAPRPEDRAEQRPREGPVPPPPGSPSEIAGRYAIRRFLGQGGRKRVYLSRDTATGTEVAVALFDTEGVGASIQARARREAEAMRKLGDHPQVVTRLDTGEEDGNPFIVSSYMAGRRRRGAARCRRRSTSRWSGGRDRRGRHPRPRARACSRRRPPRPEAGERLDRRRRPRPARRLRPGDDGGARRA